MVIENVESTVCCRVSEALANGVGCTIRIKMEDAPGYHERYLVSYDAHTGVVKLRQKGKSPYTLHASNFESVSLRQDDYFRAILGIETDSMIR